MSARAALFYAKIVLMPLGIGCLVYWAAQEESIRHHVRWSWELPAGAALSLLAMGPLALRFRHALQIAGFRLDAAQSLRINALSAFYHFFVPLSIGAEVTKFVQLRLCHPQRGAMRLAGAIVLDHILGFTALLALLVVLLNGDNPLRIGFDPRYIAVAVIAVNGTGLAIAWHLRERLGSTARDILVRIASHRGHALLAITWSCAMQVLLAIALILPASAWGIGIGFRDLLSVLVGASMLAAVPINVAGIGAAEIAGTGLYMALGLSSREALALVSLLYCYRLLFALVGGLWDFAATRRRAHPEAAVS